MALDTNYYAIKNQRDSIKTLEIQIRQISKVLQERRSGSLPSSTKTNLRDNVKSISTTLKADTFLISRIRPSQYAVSAPLNSKLFFEPRQATIPFPSRSYDDFYDEEEGLYRLKNLDAYSIGTTLLSDALSRKEKDLRSFTLPCYINNLCFNKALADLGASVSFMPFLTYANPRLDRLAHTKLINELADRIVKRPKGIVENVLVGIDKFVFLVYFIVLDMPVDINTPLIIGRPFLCNVHANVFKRKITLRVGNDKVVFKSDKPDSNIIKRAYVLTLRERIELDLEARLMGEALILNRLLDPLYGDYTKLNDLNEPLELRRNQVDDLEPTIEEGEVVDETMMDIVKTRCDNEIIAGLDKYLTYCDFDRKIHIDRAYNLQFSCMIVIYAHPKRSILLLMNKTRAPHGEELCLINPLLEALSAVSTSLLFRKAPVDKVPVLRVQHQCTIWCLVKTRLHLCFHYYEKSTFRFRMEHERSFRYNNDGLCKLFSRGISILLAVGTPSTGSGKLYFQWELSSSSGNALCILFPTRL
uniref:Reverse transcriptase domain-containing protein n=1 Tax=Tanacetum cinerariifolium TaxID=118510 RepID=A0A6L2JXU8_TANCI|nr:hypothetical protein [Tanacetum cinerariifolium]